MTIVAKIGERTYEVTNSQALAKCREIYARHVGDQNSLENAFEEVGIDFCLEIDVQGDWHGMDSPSHHDMFKSHE